MTVHSASPTLPASVRTWLFICCGMIFAMALIGAVTRLTESGLSITRWEPVMGTLPPLDAVAWQQAFEDYKAIPQFKILHPSMTLTEFKGIYFWEWVHRLWGRIIGLVFLLPLIVFAAQNRIGRPLALRLLGIFALGGLQGFIGWFMVQSGLDVRTSVSPYRLALHLGFALTIYAVILWTALPAGYGSPIPSSKRRHGWITLGLLAITMVWGAFVAGLHAGEAFNTWPLMEGDVLPPSALSLQPITINAFENLALVQFIHRWLGPLTMLTLLSWVARVWGNADARSRGWLTALACMSCLQVVLGISTVLTHAQIAVATIHQAGAITLLTLLLICLRRLASGKTARKSPTE